jgi:DNA-directed RNA polymerase specialized sigma24 family protein
MAHETRLPLGTVKSRIRLALDKLRYGLRSATLADVDA